MKDIRTLQATAQRMIEDDAENYNMMLEMDRYWEMDWDLPDSIADLEWIRKRVDTGPHDAIRNSAAIYSGLEPRIKLSPPASDEGTKSNYDKMERSLSWLFSLARRRRERLLHEIIRHAVLYDKVALQVVYRPYEEKARNLLGKNEKKRKGVAKNGPFAIVIRDPKSVHAEYSEWGLERVIYRETKPAQEVIDFWGDRAKGLMKEVKENDESTRYVTVYDYQDFDQRMVWCSWHETKIGYASPVAGDAVTLLDEKNEMEFIPWVVKTGNQTQMPLLYQIYKGKLWDDINIYETLMGSEIITYAASPRWSVEGPTDKINIDYGEPGNMAHVPPGHQLNQLQPPQLDVNLMQMLQQARSKLTNTTLPPVVQGDLPSGTAYATANLATQSGVKKLNPYKELAEEVLEDVFRSMLWWISFDGEELLTFPKNPESDTADQYALNPDYWDDDTLYLEVELTADIPTDRMARINAAVTANERLMYSQKQSLEDIGVADPQAMIDQTWDERQQNMQRELALEEQKTLQMTQIQIQAQNMQFANQMQQQQQMMAMQQQAQQPQPPPPQQGMQAALRDPALQQQIRGGGGFENTRGQMGFNPAMGGTPPAMMNPEGTTQAMLNEAREQAQEGIPGQARKPRNGTQLGG